VTAPPARFAVPGAADPGLARLSLLAAHNRPTPEIGAVYMENIARCPARVRRGQPGGQGAARLHAVAADDARIIAEADPGAPPHLEGTITAAEGMAEAGIAVHRSDLLGTAVDIGGSLSPHHPVGGRGHGLLLHPAQERPESTLTQGVGAGALRFPKKLILACARRVPLLKDPRRLPGLTRAVEVWLWMSLIDQQCSLTPWRYMSKFH
jgi:hypothetical protein